jgi:hypothetical protein
VGRVRSAVWAARQARSEAYFIALAVGEILQKTGSHALIFVVAASSYFVALVLIQLLAPKI